MYFIYFLKLLFISERDREHELGKGSGRGRGRSRLPTEQGAWREAWSWDPGIMTQAEGRCPTDWATQAPCLLFFLMMFLYLIFLAQTSQPDKVYSEYDLHWIHRQNGWLLSYSSVLPSWVVLRIIWGILKSFLISRPCTWSFRLNQCRMWLGHW